MNRQGYGSIDVYKRQEGGFAGAGVADDGHRLAGFDGEGNVFENPFNAGDGGQFGGIGFSCFERARLEPCRRLDI